MAIDLKTATPDTSFGSGAFLFGADSQSASVPSVYSVDDVFGYLLGLSNTWTGQQTFAAGTITASTPVSITQTWNDVGTTFTGFNLNVTDTNSASDSLLMDLQVGGSSAFNVDKDGKTYSKSDITVDTQFSGYRLAGYTSPALAQLAGYTRITNISAGVSINPDGFDVGYSQAVISSTGIRIIGSGAYAWNVSSADSGSPDLYLTRKGPANLRFGSSDSATPVAQTLSVQSVVAGTENTSGQPFTIQGSAGTGSGAGGSIIFQVARSDSTPGNETVQNTLVDAMTINSSGTVRIAQTGSNQRTLDIVSNSYFNVNGTILNVYGFNINGNGTGFFNMPPTAQLTWGSDTYLFSDAANTLALRNSTNAQTFNIYNTFTDASNYERGSIAWKLTGQNSVPELRIEAEASGSGTIRGISLVGSYVELSRDNVLVQNDYNENIKLHNSYGIAWCSGAANDGSSIVSRLKQGVRANVGYGVELTVGAYIAAPMFEVSDAKTISSLPSTPVTGQIARVTDGDSGLTFGQVVVNSGSGATPYLVWYNGTNWTVIGA